MQHCCKDFGMEKTKAKYAMACGCCSLCAFRFPGIHSQYNLRLINNNYARTINC